MSDSRSLSVIIPAYNAHRHLERAVRSVIATNYPGIEILIVDDGSDDGTFELAKRLCDEWPDRCRVLQHPDGCNHGVSATRNLGIEQSASSWISFLDADDFYLVNRFDSLSVLQREREDVDAIYETCRVASEESAALHRDRSSGALGEVFGISVALTGAPLLSVMLADQCWHTSAITVRRRLFARAGVFDPGKRIAEDCDLWFRLAALGNVVSGSLEKPVAVYWRHLGNTWTYELSHRLELLRAMLDAWSLARSASAESDILETFARQVPAYATRSIIAARELGRPDLALRICGQMAGARQFRYLLSYEGLRQMWASFREYRFG